MRRVLASASRELHLAQDQPLLLGRKSAPEKVASFLLRMAGEDADNGMQIDLEMRRGDIADYLGLTVETVSRILTRFRQDSLIALPMPSRVTILDIDGIETLASGESDRMM